MKLTNQVYEQIIFTFNKLIHMNSPKLVELMIILLRVVYVGIWVHERIEFYKSLLRFIKTKLNWITGSQNPFLTGLVFIKVLRMTTENHFLALSDTHYKEILGDELHILSKLWTLKRESILGIGKELIRCLIPISKANIPEIKAIMEDIAKCSGSDNTPIYLHLLSSQHPFTGLNPYVHIHIPPLMERMLIFMLTEVKKASYVKYFSWISKRFQIVRESERSILIDITRFIITCFHSFILKRSDITPRWLLLGYILKVTKNEVLSGEIKQAIFFDWLFYNKDKDSIYLIEPGLLVIFNSIREFSQLTMELIDFLDVYSENFDLQNKQGIRKSITEAFQQGEVYGIVTSLKNIFKEDKIDEDIKKVFEGLIKFNREEDSLIADSSRDDILSGHMDLNLESPSPIEDKSNISNRFPSNVKDTSNLSIVKDKSTRTIENEFFIHPSLDELLNPLTIKNFINYKTKNIFKTLLDDICKQYVNKLKTQNLLESKLIKIQPSHLDIYTSFANFYLNIFKDELISNINPYELDNDSEASSKSQKSTNVSLYIIDFLIGKYFERSEKEFNLIINFVKKILENFPNFIVRLVYYISSKVTLVNRSKLLTNKNLYIIFSKIFDDNLTLMKEKLNQFFNTCVDYLDLEILNYFIENGFQIFHNLFTDDYELISNLAIYSDNSSLNRIILDISSNKYLLIEKEFYKIINNSLSLDIQEQEKVWSLIAAHNNLNSITNLRDFLKNSTAFSKNITLKNKPFVNVCNELFKNIVGFIKFVWPNEINEQNFTINFYSLFDFPHFYSDNVYCIFSVLQNKLSSVSVKPFQFFFFTLIDEYLRQVNAYTDKLHFLENLVKLVRELVIVDRNSNKPILIDYNPQPIYGLKNLKAKLDNLAKTFKVEIE